MSRGSTSPGPLFVNLLGGFQAAGPMPSDLLLLERKRSRALLSVLALAPGKMVPRGKITALLWAEQSEETARHALRQCLLDLRHVLAKANLEPIRVKADLIGLEPSRVVVDTACFERQVARGTPEALQKAVALYRGDLLEGFSINEQAFEDWLRAERERLRSQAVGALKKLLAHLARQKVTDTTIQVAIRLLALEPFDETVHRALMRFYAESGRRSAALRQYEECVEMLGRELGVEPEAETRALYRSLVPERARPTTLPVAGAAHRGRMSKSSKGRTRLPSITHTPLIGRASDLEWLDIVSRRAYQGEPQLLVLVGEAGIGKSRLVAELAARARQHRADVLVGRGREGESVLPFAPWVEALRPALVEDLTSQLPPTIRRDLARLFPELDDGPTPPPGGLEDGLRIFEAVAHLLRQCAAAHPIAIAIEDLHWCDDMSLRLLRFLPRRLDRRPVLLVGTARPEEILDDGGPAVAVQTLARDTTCSARTLQPLSRDETIQLFRALLSSRAEPAPPALVERIWRLSEGNPFVVVECARAARARAAWRSADPLLPVPDEVRVLTEGVFAKLSDHAARLADVAAVIGRDFDIAVLRHAGDSTESKVVDGLEELVRRHVLREVQGQFDFTHDRVREVCYARLLGPRRALLHRRVAEALEVVYAADLAPHFAAIGTHYRQAGASEQACRYLARAGFQAWERGAGREALACFEEALRAVERLHDTKERRELHVKLRLAANGVSLATGSYERGRAHLEAVEKLVGTLSDRRWDGRVSAALSNAYRRAGAADRALWFGERALQLAVETQDRRLDSVARYVLGQREHTAGNFRRSLEYFATLLGDDAPAPDSLVFLPYTDKPERRGLFRFWMAWSQVQLGEFETGMHLVKESFREIAVLDDPLGTLRLFAYSSLGLLQNGAGDFPAAIRAFESALAVYRDDCHQNFNCILTWGLGLADVLSGRIAEGLEILDKAEAIERRKGSNAFRLLRLLHHGWALLNGGRIDEAERIGTEALRLAREGENRPSEAGAHGLLGDVARLREPMAAEAIERHLLNCLTVAEPLEMRPLVARCHLRLAWLYERAGRPGYENHAAAARSLFEEMGNPKSVDAAGVH